MRENHRQSREEGSAYIITLMVLLVLTILGLTLTLITQTELMVGSTERTIEKVFYAADSGIDVATARVMTTSSYDPFEYQLIDSRQVGSSGAFDRDEVVTIRDEVEVSQVLAISQNYCNLCQVNQGDKYWEINHLIMANATRTGIATGNDDEVVPLARKRVAAMVEIQPIKGAFDSITDPDQPLDEASEGM